MSSAEVVEIALRSAAVATGATLGCVLPAVALGFALARNRVPGADLVRAVVALPMVMPPVAVGLVLLWALGPTTPWSGLWSALGGAPIFTPGAAAIAAGVVGFPLLCRAAEQSFSEVDPRYEELARSLGARPFQAFVRVSLPLARRGLLYGGLLCFTRALGEFGATAIVAGIIPGRTETLSLGIWSRLQQGDDAGAALLVGVSFALALVALVAAERWLGTRPR